MFLSNHLHTKISAFYRLRGLIFTLFTTTIYSLTMNTVNIVSERIRGIEFSNLLSEKVRIKCYCLSDIHADAEKSQVWVKSNCRRIVDDLDAFTVMLLPGDIGSEIDRLESVFKILVSQYDAVVFVPGNHEAWRKGIAAGGSALKPEERAFNRMATDSIVKLNEVLDCAKSCGVYVGPLRIQTGATNDSKSKSVVLFPLYSWYHNSWDKEPEIKHPDYIAVEEAMPFARKWGDYSLCLWPEELISQKEFQSTTSSSTVLAEAFASLNEPFLEQHLNKKKDYYSFPLPTDGKVENSSNIIEETIKEETVLSFSHFLPRQELCPEKRFLLEPLLSKVIGSDPLEEQIRRLKPTLHIFGHTHIPIDMTIDDIRYLQWPLGYQREAKMQCQCIFDSGPLLVFDSDLGTGHSGIPPNLASENTAWSKYYKSYERDPNNVYDLAPWVMKRLDSFGGLVSSRNKGGRLWPVTEGDLERPSD